MVGHSGRHGGGAELEELRLLNNIVKSSTSSLDLSEVVAALAVELEASVRCDRAVVAIIGGGARWQEPIALYDKHQSGDSFPKVGSRIPLPDRVLPVIRGEQAYALYRLTEHVAPSVSNALLYERAMAVEAALATVVPRLGAVYSETQ